MEYDVHNAADYGVPQNRKRVIFIATRKEAKSRIQLPDPMYGEGKIPYITVMEAIGDLPPLESGDMWGKTALHPYGINKQEGYVICPACLKYNKVKRTNCHNCHQDLNDPIKGGVLRFPGLGTLIDTKVDIDNKLMREQFNLL